MSLEEVLVEVKGMNEKFDSLRNDVDSLMSRERSRSPVRKSLTPVRRSDGVHLTPYADACRGDWAIRKGGLQCPGIVLRKRLMIW